MLALINTAYYGLTQAAPVFLTMVIGWRIGARALGAGLVAGEAVVLWLYLAPDNAVSAWLELTGINIGLAALVVNVAVVAAARLVWPAHDHLRGLRDYTPREIAAMAPGAPEQPRVTS